MVWESMRLLYGASFGQTYGTDPNPLWVEAIGELTNEQCGDGFRRLRSEPRKFPPNLTEFIAACKPKDAGVRYLGVPMTEEERAALYLPRPDVPREKIDGFLASMRAKVRR
jgi:hypothetical protein